MQPGENLICVKSLTTHQKKSIYKLHRERVLTKLARGVYYPTTDYSDHPFRTRFWLRSLACGIEGRTLVDRSAGCLLKLPVLFNGNCPVEIMGYGRRDGLVLRRLPPDDVVVATIFGHEVRITSPAMTVVDNARWHSAGEAIRVGDEVVREGRATQADIERCMRLPGHRSGAEKARHALKLINGRAESPRESDVRVTLWENGFRPPKQQVEIVDVHVALSAGLTSFTRSDRSPSSTTAGTRPGESTGVIRIERSIRNAIENAGSSRRGLTPSE